MDVLEAIEGRRSVRKFLEIPVEWEKVGEIIDAGRLAPSAGNLQPWKFVVVQDQEKRAQLAEACLQQHWMANAPVHIVVCSELTKIKQFYGLRGERLYSVQNCACAVQNMLLAAHNLGLGSCFVGAFDENMISRVLSIPEEVRPQAILPIGYPDEQPKEPIHYRIENVTFFEKWGNRVADFDAVLWNYRAVDKAKIAVGGIAKLATMGVQAAHRKIQTVRKNAEERKKARK